MNVRPPYGDWNVPGPPRQPGSPLRRQRVAAGIGTALLGHFVTAAPLLVVWTSGSWGPVEFSTAVLLIGQVVLFLGCLIIGSVLAVRQESGFGIGLLIGWAVGVVIAPVLGFGLCVLTISASGR